ncbi:MAG TPA: MBL fold metallo-hydrolase [Humisphaera sp.]|jgi:glyoxylase-like metal-dependent hydrolase (beta-lactamase superfamily II)|nr:MBL fold metallo-hydrolase [Humisphaera sp.]
MTATAPTDINASPHYRWKLLRAGPLRLDGGSMFGVVPRALWSKAAEPDEIGRILLGHNCLLLERADGGTGPRRILIETGSGDPQKYGPKTRSIFGLTDQWIETAIAEAGLTCDQIEQVIVSHLHFDHAGGVTRAARNGEQPDWIPPGAKPQAGLKLTFPNAPIFVQRLEWEDALINRSVMTRTYLREHLDPIRDRVRLIDAPPPFEAGYVPKRDELPRSSVAQRQVEILPGIFVLLVPGHTWGQQTIRFTDERGQQIVFTPDLLPTANHVGAAYNMAYDVEPYMSTVCRHWFLEEAAAGDWLLVLDHEPHHPLQRVKRDGKGWYQLTPEVV